MSDKKFGEKFHEKLIAYVYYAEIATLPRWNDVIEV